MGPLSESSDVFPCRARIQGSTQYGAHLVLGVCTRRTDSVVLFHCVGEVKVDRESAHQSRDLLEAGLAQPVKETILLVGVLLGVTVWLLIIYLPDPPLSVIYLLFFMSGVPSGTFIVAFVFVYRVFGGRGVGGRFGGSFLGLGCFRFHRFIA